MKTASTVNVFFMPGAATSPVLGSPSFAGWMDGEGLMRIA